MNTFNTSLENNTFTYSNSKQNSIHDYYNNDDSDVNLDNSLLNRFKTMCNNK